MEWIVDGLGWLGALMILCAYFLVSRQMLSGESRSYQLLNLLGATLLAVNSMYYGALPSVGLNMIWVGIAVYFLTIGRPQSAA